MAQFHSPILCDQNTRYARMQSFASAARAEPLATAAVSDYRILRLNKEPTPGAIDNGESPCASGHRLCKQFVWRRLRQRAVKHVSRVVVSDRRAVLARHQWGDIGRGADLTFADHAAAIKQRGGLACWHYKLRAASEPTEYELLRRRSKWSGLNDWAASGWLRPSTTGWRRRGASGRNRRSTAANCDGCRWAPRTKTTCSRPISRRHVGGQNRRRCDGRACRPPSWTADARTTSKSRCCTWTSATPARPSRAPAGVRRRRAVRRWCRRGTRPHPARTASGPPTCSSWTSAGTTGAASRSDGPSTTSASSSAPCASCRPRRTPTPLEHRRTRRHDAGSSATRTSGGRLTAAAAAAARGRGARCCSGRTAAGTRRSDSWWRTWRADRWRRTCWRGTAGEPCPTSRHVRPLRPSRPLLPPPTSPDRRRPASWSRCTREQPPTTNWRRCSARSCLAPFRWRRARWGGAACKTTAL